MATPAQNSTCTERRQLGQSPMAPSPGRDPSDYCTILGRECAGVGQIPLGLAPAWWRWGVCACEQRPLGGPVLSTLRDAGEWPREGVVVELANRSKSRPKSKGGTRRPPAGELESWQVGPRVNQCCGQGPGQQFYLREDMRTERGKGGADRHGGLKGSKNRSVSVQIESYLRGGANKPNVRRPHFRSLGQSLPRKPHKGPVVLITQVTSL